MSDHQVVVDTNGYLVCPRHSIMLLKSHRGSWSKYECPSCADWYVSMRPLDVPDVEEQEMTDLTRYRPKAGKYIGGSMEQVLGNLRIAENGGDIAEVVDALEHWVPDSTLQDIADAWNHLQALEQMGDSDSTGEWTYLAALLDALVEGNNNE